MAEHRGFASKVLPIGVEKKKGTKVFFVERLEKCKGHYMIACDAISDGWSETEALTLDIVTGPRLGILQAAVSLGIIEGTMLLAFDEAALDDYVGTDDTDDSAFDEDDDEDGYEYDGVSKKRSAPSSGTATEYGTRPSKKVKVESDMTTLRLYFRLRGRETGESQIFYKAHKGYLDFTDDRYIAFKGIGQIPYVGDKTEMQGYKMSTRARRQAAPWGSFSEAAYEQARVGRWR
ncbi:hypothetical protein CC80DRAFT_42038 [Byssothecium circinans]|uniref:Uncharacterized protein n=1 Tax=Byssothecium circinans TaxID=147558 RepID=A0A6A5U0B7_9PLEO|nr:hypothetical protein CC80DRAFT_42038 [Byssothecium circinans]